MKTWLSLVKLVEYLSFLCGKDDTEVGVDEVEAIDMLLANRPWSRNAFLLPDLFVLIEEVPTRSTLETPLLSRWWRRWLLVAELNGNPKFPVPTLRITDVILIGVELELAADVGSSEIEELPCTPKLRPSAVL